MNFKYIPASKVRSRFPIWVAIINSHQRWNRIETLGYVVFPVDFERLTFSRKEEKPLFDHFKELNVFQKVSKWGTGALFFPKRGIHRLKDFKARRTVQGRLPIHVLSVFFFHVSSLNTRFTPQRDILSRLSSRWLLMCTPWPCSPHHLQCVEAIKNISVLKTSSQSSQIQGVGGKDLQDHRFLTVCIALPGQDFM